MMKTCAACVVASMTLFAYGATTMPNSRNILADTFDVKDAAGKLVSTSYQNGSLPTRQSGEVVTKAWEDFNKNTMGDPADWDGRIGINADGQLQINTGGGEAHFWAAGLSELPQSPHYRVSWEARSDNEWSFFRFNASGKSPALDYGILIAGDAVQLFVNGEIKINHTYTPSLPGGLHAIVVEMNAGRMTATVDGHEWKWELPADGLGTGASGIGTFCVFANASPNGTVTSIDNFKYEVMP